MIKLKSLITEQSSDYVYHVTPKRNLRTMIKHGIIPHQCEPPHVEPPFVFMFDKRETMEDAVMGWLGDKLGETTPLVVLTINAKGLDIQPAYEKFEVVSYKTIPWNRVVKVEDI